MQVVPGASRALSVGPGRSRGPVARAAKADDDGRLQLEYWESERLTNRLYRVVCSSRWEQDLKSLILDKEIAYKEDQAKELLGTGVYPPGGERTRMKRCCCCGRWTPRGRAVREREVKKSKEGQVTVNFTPWQALCDDCHVANMPELQMVQLPSSPGFTRRFFDGEIAAHLEAGGFYLHTKRRRFLDDRGRLREEAADEDGFVHDLVDVQNRVAGDAAPAAAEAA